MSEGDRIGVGYVEARLNTDRLKQDTQEMERTLGQRLQATGQKMQATGRTLSRRVTAPIVAMGGAIVATSVNFETSMNRVGALTGAVGDDFEKLDRRAQELGRTTQFSASQAADGMGFLAQAGLDTTEIYDAMPGVLNLAAAGQLELAEAADIASNIMSGMNLEVSDLDNIMDVMAVTASSANTDVRQLGDAMVYAAPVAAGAGVELEEVAAAIGLMGDAGIQGSMAGTSLRMAISQLINPSGAAAAVIERLGINTHDAEGNMLPLVDIMGQMEDAGADAGDMMEMFGQRAGPAMTALLGIGSDALAEFTGELQDSGGAAAEMADRQMEGIPGALARMRSAFEGAAIAIGRSGLVSMVANIAESIAGFLQKVSEANPMLLRLGLMMAGAAAAAGPLLWIAGSMVTQIGALSTAVGGLVGVKVALNRAMGALLVGAMNPMVIAIGAAAVAIGGLIWWLNEARGEHVSLADSVDTLADSLGLSYERAEIGGQNLAEGQEQTAQQFITANSEMIRSLREMSDEAAQASLISMGWELVQGGVDPEEAFEAIQRMADAAGVELPVELSADDLADAEVGIDALVDRVRFSAERVGGFWQQLTTGSLRDLNQDMQETGEIAARMFDQGDLQGSMRLMQGALDAVAESGGNVEFQARQMFGAFSDTGAVDGMSNSIRGLDDFLREAANGTIFLAEENREFATALRWAMLSGMDLGEALEWVESVMAEGGPAAEELAGDLEDLDGAMFGADTTARDLAEAVHDGEMSMDEARAAARELGIDIAELEGEFAELTEEVQTATEALAEYEAQQRAIADPVFAARRALNALDEAQENLNKLVEDGKQGTEEFEQALIDEWRAAEDAEFALRNLGAAHEDGTTSLEQIKARADDLVTSMGLSGEAADLARELFVELFAEQAKLPEVKEIDVVVNDSASGTLGRIQGQLDRLPRRVHTQVTSSGATIQHREQVMHDGGWVTGPTREIPALLERGEFVLSNDMLDGLRPIPPDLSGLMGGDGPAVPAGRAAAAVESQRRGDVYLTVEGEPSPVAVFRARDLAAEYV